MTVSKLTGRMLMLMAPLIFIFLSTENLSFCNVLIQDFYKGVFGLTRFAWWSRSE